MISHQAVRCIAAQNDVPRKLPGGLGKEFNRDRKMRARGEGERKNKPGFAEVIRVKGLFAEHDVSSPGVCNC